MGLSHSSVGKGALDKGEFIKKRSQDDLVIALAGNPNVGKSTVFNGLTGLHQHTGNWPGKTVATAQGEVVDKGRRFLLVDIPGTYSLMAHSPEEEVARNFICFGSPDAVAVVCDATCLSRNLNLVLQILEVTPRVVVCVNLMDEARRKGIELDLHALSRELGVPVIGTVAHQKKTLGRVLSSLACVAREGEGKIARLDYGEEIERAIEPIEKGLEGKDLKGLSARFVALRLLEGDVGMLGELVGHIGKETLASPEIKEALELAKGSLARDGLEGDRIREKMVGVLVERAEQLARCAAVQKSDGAAQKDRKIDRILTGRWSAYPAMLLLLALVFFLTAVGANYPSKVLASLFSWLEGWLLLGLEGMHAPPLLIGLLIDGVWRVLSTVVAVMLPPMAIFFPLFTFLEDVGYLPRVAYNLDRPFCRCGSCGKQALTMCMGFGCNAAGVTGCRIIDSPRERLLAILTNSFVPCNGRFPTLIAVIGIFLADSLWGMGGVSLLLTLFVLIGILLSFLATRLLCATVLSGVSSSFVLELPPYRRPAVGKILVRSLFDRTVFVLGRAVMVAVPAGALLFLLANISAGDASLLSHASAALDPIGRFFGLDGAILLGFVLGFPANEIVLPIILMIYCAGGSISELGSLEELGGILAQNGWSTVTAICFLCFMLLHWPCSTTVLTVKKETGSLGWTVLSVFLPTVFGLLLCLLVRLAAAVLGA